MRRNREREGSKSYIFNVNVRLYLRKLLFFQVEVGDVILKVNETDVNRFSTKEGKGDL